MQERKKMKQIQLNHENESKLFVIKQKKDYVKSKDQMKKVKTFNMKFKVKFISYHRCL